METHDLGRLFAVWNTLSEPKGQRLIFRAPIWEIDPPYRCSYTYVIRFPRGRGLMLGWWRRSPATSLQEHFTLALSANVLGEIHSFADHGPQHATKTLEIPWDQLTEDQKKEAGSRSMVVSFSNDYDPL